MTVQSTVALADRSRSGVVIALNHVQLAMPKGEEAQAEDFYCGVLGFDRVEKPPHLAARGGCWFHSNGVHLHLGIDDQFVAARKAHPGFVVDNLSEVRRRLEAIGSPVVWDTQIDGFERFYTSDPFGNRLEIMQRVSPGSPCEG
jgi:catechol 2,3-dioxygenase-like lactoylglutathione lyase family enzyme